MGTNVFRCFKEIKVTVLFFFKLHRDSVRDTIFLKGNCAESNLDCYQYEIKCLEKIKLYFFYVYNIKISSALFNLF